MSDILLKSSSDRIRCTIRHGLHSTHLMMLIGWLDGNSCPGNATFHTVIVNLVIVDALVLHLLVSLHAHEASNAGFVDETVL